MANRNKKTIRSNKAQINYLCQYMIKNPRFAEGNYCSPMGALKENEKWEELKLALNELGSARSVEQWKICWRDQKRKARAEAGALSQSKNAKANVVPVPDLSENSALVLRAIGQEVAFGPEESPIGSSPLAQMAGIGDQTEQETETPSDASSNTDTKEYLKIKIPVQRRRSVKPPELEKADKDMSKASYTLNQAMLNRDEQNKIEDECELYGKLLAYKLRKYSDDERQEIMYDIDGLLLRRRRNCSP